MRDKLFRILILILLINSGCEKSGNINGHWHIVNEQGFPNEFATLDIDDTISLWGKVRYADGMRSIIDKEKKIITLPPIETNTEYLYKLVNDTLVLMEKNGGEVLYGIKKDKCSLESDFFASDMVDIDLPIFNKSIRNQKDISGMSLYLLLGKPKKIIKHLYGDSIRLAVHNGFKEMEDLEFINIKHDLSIPEKYRDQISTLVFADKGVSMAKLKELVEKQRGINDRKIFLVGKLKNNSKTKNELIFMPFERNIIFDNNEGLEAWVKKKR